MALKKTKKKVGNREEVILKLVPYDAQKHLPQKEGEKLGDLFFLLLTLHKGEELNIPITSGILLKTLFNAEVDLARNDIDFLETKFYVYKKGPFNKNFYNYIDELAEADLLKKDTYNLSLTTKGLSLFQPLIEEFKKEGNYKLIDSIIEKDLKECKDFSKAIKCSHSIKVLDEETKTIKILQEIVENLDQGSLKCIEPIKKPKEKVILSGRIINRLLNIESGVAESDYEATEVLSDIDQLLKDATRDTRK